MHLEVQASVDERPPGHGLGAADDARHALGHVAHVGAQHHVGIEDGEEPVEVAVVRGGEEGLDDLALLVEAGVGHDALALHPAPRAAGQLPRRLGRAVHDRRDVGERHREHVVEHEREPLWRRQGVEHDEHRQPHRVGHERLVLGVGAVGAVDDRLGQAQVERVLAPRLAGAEHVQRHAAHHRRQPRVEALDVLGVGAVVAQPRLLDGVVGLAERAEHAVGHRTHARPPLLELLRLPLSLVHRSRSFVASGLPIETHLNRPM